MEPKQRLGKGGFQHNYRYGYWKYGPDGETKQWFGFQHNHRYGQWKYGAEGETKQWFEFQHNHRYGQ